jgi:hypothetical protein
MGMSRINQNSPFGKGGARGKRVGWVPGANVVARGLVAEDEALATIEANGTAVGFVDRRVKVTEGVEVGAEVGVAGMDGEDPDEVDLEEVVEEPPVALPVA